MDERSDAQLLCDYAAYGSEPAFRALVVRHTDLVYSAALRQVFSPDLARDVTQRVFTDLARKAGPVGAGLRSGSSLAGWLYHAARFAARDLYRHEARRTQRERQAMDALHPAPENSPDWKQLQPVLDAAMAELDEADRDAVLLRYFKNQNYRAVGAALGVSDDTAQKRVSRAVDRLRKAFASHGLKVGAGGLTAALSAHAVQAAPAGLALSISTAAVLTGPGLAASTTVQALAMSTLSKTVFTATLVVLAGAGLHQARQASHLRDEVESLRQQGTTLTARVRQLQNERDKAQSLAVSREEDTARNESVAAAAREVDRRTATAAPSAGAAAASDTPDYLPRESWAFAGYASPESAFQSFAWASGKGEVKTMLASVTPDERARMLRQFEGKTDDEIVAALEADMEAVKAYRILKRETLSESEIVLTVFGEGKGKDKTVRLRFQQTGGGWKLAGPVGRK